MNAAYFNNIRGELLSILEHAARHVYIAMAWFTSAELFGALQKCRSRGVDVKLILLDDAINWMPYAPDFNELKKSGADIRIYDTSLKFMHNKFCIVDLEKVVTGSYNWTYYAEMRNLENVVITDENSLIEQYLNQFNKLWDEALAKDKFPRLSFDEISAHEGTNLIDLNKEIKSVEEIKNLPQRVDIIPVHQSIIIEKGIPYSMYNIGLHVTNGDNKDAISTFIIKDQKLPFTEKKSFYNYSDTRENVMLSVLYGDSESASHNHLLVEKKLNDIIGSNKDYELEISVEMTLQEDGFLKASVQCLGRELVVTTLNPKLVKYDYRESKNNCK